MIRAVIDTNVLVSGLLTRSGNEALILLAVVQGFVRPCLSDAILAEYTEVLTRGKFGFDPDTVADLLSMLRDRGEQVEPDGRGGVLPDAGDDRFLFCAEAANAEYIVTGNKRHFPQALCGVIKIVNAAELLDWITLAI